MSLKKNLQLTLILCSIVPTIIVTTLAYNLVSNKLISVRYDNLYQMAEANSNGLSALVDVPKSEINMLSFQKEIESIVNCRNLNYKEDTTYYKNEYIKAYNFLTQRKNLHSYCINISIFDRNGNTILSTDDYTNYYSINFDKTLEDLKFSDVTFASSGIYPLSNYDGTVSNCIDIGTVIKEESDTQTRGYIISTISLDYFEDFLKSISLDKTGSGTVINEFGQIVYDANTNLIGKDTTYPSLKNIYTKYINNTIPQSGNFELKINNKNRAFGYNIIPELKWTVLVSQEISEINGLATIILVVLVWSLILIIILAIFVSIEFAKKITKPIIKLRDAMKIASDGNLDVQCNISSNNEIGEVSKSFNKMIHIIKNNYDDLASMHEELLANEEELRANYNHIEYLAYHDVLTSLPNKLSFYNRLNEVLLSNEGSQQIHSIYFVDLDNFKVINDTLGHDYGDELLTQTALKLSTLLTKEDMLARAGGDEFLIFKWNLSTENEALNFGDKILEQFKAPFNLNGEIAYISMSIGVSLYPKNGMNHQTLIKNADIAMYRSKDTGKNKLTVFDRSMEAELSRNTDILEILRNALKNNEVYLMYQPQINPNTKEVMGFEALTRLNSKKLGMISPVEFIPIAEESGLIVELGKWALREACSFNRALINQGFKPCVVSVNISSIQLNRTNFLNELESILKETNLPPEYLEIEITESTLVSSVIDAATLLHNIQNLGVRISLDDFGTGYSSLNYLTKMPINTLKIDKSFIDNICINKKDNFIAASIIELAHNLNIRVVAEGVEEVEQFTLLHDKKCDLIQGYYFSKPLTPTALIKLL